jgi:hypothetical protein
VGTPKELENFIIKSDPIEKAYAARKDDFVIYEIKVRDFFAIGDALFIDSVYYFESAETLQFTLRCKNSALERITNGSDDPFRLTLNVFTEEAEEGKAAEAAEPSAMQSLNKAGDRYVYFVYSFGGVKIDYAKSKAELYIFFAEEENYPDTDYSADRFTLFDINTQKEKIPAKKFNWN